MSASRPHAEIAGAGFAGLAAAAALGQRGWSVRVHEANRELREAGAGIFLWDNGITTLRHLGLADRVLHGAHLAPSSDVVVDGRPRSQQPTNSPDSYLMATMTRQHLYAAMLEGARAAGAEIVPGSEVAGAEATGRLRLRDGRVLDADLVIGADGVGSVVRDSLGIPTRRQRFDDGIIRTLIRHPHTPEGDDARVVDYWVTTPLPRRVLYVPCGDEAIYLALMARIDDTHGSAVPVDRALWASLFPPLAGLIARIGDEWRHDVYRSTDLDAWSCGRVVILGDAAHAMPPTLGQGAGFAIGNAVALADALTSAHTVEAALAHWEQTVRPLTEQTQRRAEELARLGPRRIDIPKHTLGTLASGQPMVSHG